MQLFATNNLLELGTLKSEKMMWEAKTGENVSTRIMNFRKECGVWLALLMMSHASVGDDSDVVLFAGFQFHVELISSP